MENLKTNERMAAIRNDAKAQLGGLDNATKVGSGVYVIATELGYAKVQISAIKDADFDAVAAGEAYEAEIAEKAVKAEEKADAKAVKDAEKAAAKAEKAVK